MQRVEAFFHMTPHFAYPLMVFLSVLLLPALILMPATNPRMMLLIDLPLCIGTTGSLARVLRDGRARAGAPRIGRDRQLPALLALGAGLAPHLTKAVFEGLGSMAGEFVRTPKKGATKAQRYRARADLPLIEIALCLFSFASVVASLETGHWFADAVRDPLRVRLRLRGDARRHRAVGADEGDRGSAPRRPGAPRERPPSGSVAGRRRGARGRAADFRLARPDNSRVSSGLTRPLAPFGHRGGESRGRSETSMTKAEIVQALYTRVGGFSKKESADMVDLVFEMMKETLGRGEKIKISGFGNFVLRDKRQRPGRNPQTGEPDQDQRASRPHVQGEPDPQAGAEPEPRARRHERPCVVRVVGASASAPGASSTAAAASPSGSYEAKDLTTLRSDVEPPAQARFPHR